MLKCHNRRQRSISTNEYRNAADTGDDIDEWSDTLVETVRARDDSRTPSTSKGRLLSKTPPPTTSAATSISSRSPAPNEWSSERRSFDFSSILGFLRSRKRANTVDYGVRQDDDEERADRSMSASVGGNRSPLPSILSSGRGDRPRKECRVSSIPENILLGIGQNLQNSYRNQVRGCSRQRNSAPSIGMQKDRLDKSWERMLRMKANEKKVKRSRMRANSSSAGCSSARYTNDIDGQRRRESAMPSVNLPPSIPCKEQKENATVCEATQQQQQQPEPSQMGRSGRRRSNIILENSAVNVTVILDNDDPASAEGAEEEGESKSSKYSQQMVAPKESGSGCGTLETNHSSSQQVSVCVCVLCK